MMSTASRRPLLSRAMRLSLCALLTALAPVPAVAATYTVKVQGPLNLGTVAAAPTGDTVFRIDPSGGGVTAVSGAGRRVSNGGANAQVTVSCQSDRQGETTCTDARVVIRIGTIGSLTGRARALTNFTVSMGTATLAVAPSGTNPLTFELAPPGENTPRTFNVGADFPIAGDDSNLASGAAQNSFYVYVLAADGQMQAGDSERGRATVLRAVAVARTADLSFGRIQRPTSGSNTVTLNANNGNRTLSGAGNAFLYPTPAPTRAAFTITGEGGQQVSITVPSAMTLSGPSTIPVTITSTAPATRSLGGSSGSQASYSFTVGGSFTLSPTTPIGDYAGVLSVNVDYN
ncbi:MAG: hypothetical protein DI570_03965 [Phenylobacterium zucineum]|nr:MAG: hypothetical protein DI570_03965 [Phenylobacterium zucineum]